MVHIKSEKGCLKIIQTPLYYYIYNYVNLRLLYFTVAITFALYTNIIPQHSSKNKILLG